MQNFYLAISIHLVKLCAIILQCRNLLVIYCEAFNLAIYCEAFDLAIFYKYSAMEEFVCNLCQTLI
jgi:hypothetical protein